MKRIAEVKARSFTKQFLIRMLVFSLLAALFLASNNYIIEYVCGDIFNLKSTSSKLIVIFITSTIAALILMTINIYKIRQAIITVDISDKNIMIKAYDYNKIKFYTFDWELVTIRYYVTGWKRANIWLVIESKNGDRISQFPTGYWSEDKIKEVHDELNEAKQEYIAKGSNAPN